MIAVASVLLWFSFAFCLSMTAAGILLLFRYPRQSLAPSFPLLQIAFILLSVFGYYGLWTRILLLGYFRFDNAPQISGIVTLLGTPFLIIGLCCLLAWACRLQQRPVLAVLALVLCSDALLGLLLLDATAPMLNNVRTQWSLAGGLLTSSTCLVLATGRQPFADAQGTRGILAVLALCALLYLSYFTPLPRLAYYESAFAIAFFLLGSALPVLYVYRAQHKAPPQTLGGFEGLIAHYGISKREADVIHGIYAGKTNQEIANTLFLSLQTVKDHTSRIYQKTFVKNRGQLLALLRHFQ